MNKELIELVSESADINGHIAFIGNLLKSHTWTNDRYSYYYSQLEVIRNKQMDSNMYMAVVGEFSAGKSSFINAVIRDDLLKTDVLQATTSAATEIIYDKELNVKVQKSDGTFQEYIKNLSFWKRFWRSIFTPKDFKLKNEIREYISVVTADETVASKISKVSILHPSEVLAKGLVIIDTSGANVENERHKAVTSYAIKTIADAAIIIIPADKPLSQTLLDFINSNLRDVISKCIFIINKMDLIREKEHQRTLQYIEAKIKTEFEIEKVNVFPYTPLAVLKYHIPTTEFYCAEDLFQILLQQSMNTEAKVYETLKEQRIFIQLHKLVLLIQSLFIDLEKDLKNMELNYKIRHEALEQNKIKEFSSFVNSQKQHHQQSLLKECYLIKQELINLVEDSKNELLNEIHNKVYSAKNAKILLKYLKKKKQLRRYIMNAQEELSRKLPSVINSLTNCAAHEQESFEKEFKNLYSNLATLGGYISVNELSINKAAVGTVRSNMGEKIQVLKSAVNSDQNKATGASLGGVALGATIGTAVFPGVGTLIGGVIGSLAGLLFRKSLDRQKNEYYNNIKDSVNDLYSKAQSSTETLSDEVINQMIQDLFSIIDNYFIQYDALVNQMIRRDEEEKQLLERWSIQINRELSELKNRHIVIENLKNQII